MEASENAHVESCSTRVEPPEGDTSVGLEAMGDNRNHTGRACSLWPRHSADCSADTQSYPQLKGPKSCSYLL